MFLCLLSIRKFWTIQHSGNFQSSAVKRHILTQNNVSIRKSDENPFPIGNILCMAVGVRWWCILYSAYDEWKDFILIITWEELRFFCNKRVYETQSIQLLQSILLKVLILKLNKSSKLWTQKTYLRRILLKR